MAATWSEIKQYFNTFKPEDFPNFVDSATSGTNELAIYARLGNAQIAGYNHKFSWLIREYSLTLTGASSYDLSTLIPDLAQVIRPYGTGFPNNEPLYQSLTDFNILVGGMAITMQGKTLKIKNGPSSGTLVIPYYSNYLVATSGGTRQRDFSADNDVSIVPEEHLPALLECIDEYVQRKTKKSKYVRAFQMPNGSIQEVTPALYFLQQAALVDVPMHKIVTDWRFA